MNAEEINQARQGLPPCLFTLALYYAGRPGNDELMQDVRGMKHWAGPSGKLATRSAFRRTQWRSTEFVPAGLAGNHIASGPRAASSRRALAADIAEDAADSWEADDANPWAVGGESPAVPRCQIRYVFAHGMYLGRAHDARLNETRDVVLGGRIIGSAANLEGHYVDAQVYEDSISRPVDTIELARHGSRRKVIRSRLAAALWASEHWMKRTDRW